jgi:polar amino acid transport system substrate-binding protein
VDPFRLAIALILTFVFTSGCISAPIVPEDPDSEDTLTAFAIGVNASLKEIDRDLMTAADRLSRSGITGREANETLDWLASRSPNGSSVITITTEGRIAAAMPERYGGAIGIDIGSQEHVRQSLLERGPLVSPVFSTVEGFDAVAIQRPVVDSTGVLIGLVSLAFDPALLLAEDADRALSGTNSTAWAAETNGRVIFDRTRGDVVGRNLLVDPAPANESGLAMLAKRITAEPVGQGSYSFVSSDGAVTPKNVLWGTAGIHGREWRLVMVRDS